MAEKGWKDWMEEVCFFWRSRLYVIVLSLTAAFSYGFLVTHQTIGIDDTPYSYYFEEGLNAIVGRWFLYLLNKICRISDFSPFITDLAGVLILMAAVTVWCVLLRRICRDRVSLWGYLFFGCVFLSCPLISEVYTYYLHNGISVGYLCTGVSLCFIQALRERWERGERRAGRALALLLGAAVFLFVALGCYESFMIVWLLGVLLVLLTGQYMGRGGRVFLSLGCAAGAAVCALVLRSVMIAAVIGLFRLGEMRDQAVQRSVTELLGWIFQEGAFAEFAMAVKRAYVMYGVFAYAYYPIRIFVLAAVVMVLFSLWRGIWQKAPWIPVLTLGSLVVCFLLIPVEGKVTLYRAAQFLPVICGYGAFLAVHAAEGAWKGLRIKAEEQQKTGAGERPGNRTEEQQKTEAGEKPGSRTEEQPEIGAGTAAKPKARGILCRAAAGLCRYGVLFALWAVLWNQCYDMNRWFYVDWLKYEAARDTMRQIALELEKNFDTGKPVVFTGNYEIPRDIIADAYVGYGTETFFKLKRWTDPIDEHLLEKFYRDYGVWVAQTPALSVIEWGRYAFGDDSELVRFFAMHGYGLQPYTAAENYEALEISTMTLPGFPEAGSIVDMGDFIVVHF